MRSKAVIWVCSGLAFAAAATAVYYAIKPRTLWWEGKDDLFSYALLSDGPWLGEGFSAYISVRENSNGRLFYYRRILSGLDTNEVPGFRSAVIDSKSHAVIITIVDNGKSIDVPIPILGWEGYWRDYLPPTPGG